MDTFSPPIFFDTARRQLKLHDEKFNGTFSQDAVDGINLFLATAMRRKTRRGFLAYLLSTAWWETGRTMQPVREAFYLKNTLKTDAAVEAWRKKNLRYYPWYGRGHVQLTWERNYKLASQRLGVDFISNPDAVMIPEHSVLIAFIGSEEGWFTGKSLDDYIDDIDEPDTEDLREFKNARRVINGTDKADKIGRIALAFEHALATAGYPWMPTDAPTIDLKPNPTPPKPPVVPPAAPKPAPTPEPEPVHWLVRLLRWLFGIKE